MEALDQRPAASEVVQTRIQTVCMIPQMGDVSTAPPGWYDDGSGHRRWWDGTSWGPYQQPTPAEPAKFPHGWYDYGDGRQRWWTGTAWGKFEDGTSDAEAEPTGWPVMWPVPSTADNAPTGDQVLLIAGWASLVFLPVLFSGATYLTKGKKDRFARWHSAESLNLQFTWLCANVLLSVAIAVAGDRVATWVPNLGQIVLMAVAVLCLTVGASNAWQGNYWRCPLAVPFLRAHRREGAPQPS